MSASPPDTNSISRVTRRSRRLKKQAEAQRAYRAKQRAARAPSRTDVANLMLHWFLTLLLENRDNDGLMKVRAVLIEGLADQGFDGEAATRRVEDIIERTEDGWTIRPKTHLAPKPPGLTLASLIAGSATARSERLGENGWLAVGPRVDAGGLRHEFEHGELLPMLCGRAAEEIILGAASAGAGGTDASDLARATALSATLLGRLGLGASLRYADAVDIAEVDGILRRAYAEAQLLVLRHRASIERLAEVLLEKRVLTASDIADFARQDRLAG